MTTSGELRNGHGQCRARVRPTGRSDVWHTGAIANLVAWRHQWFDKNLEIPQEPHTTGVATGLAACHEVFYPCHSRDSRSRRGLLDPGGHCDHGSEADEIVTHAAIPRLFRPCSAEIAATSPIRMGQGLNTQTNSSSARKARKVIGAGHGRN